MADFPSESKKILLVDDDKEIIAKLKLPLMIRDFDVLEAYDGLRALDIIRRSSPDLVVLDILMPKLDGLKLARLFKFDERFSHIPVIVVSHVAKSQDDSLLKEIGIDACFVKPVNVEAIVQEIEKLLK